MGGRWRSWLNMGAKSSTKATVIEEREHIPEIVYDYTQHGEDWELPDKDTLKCQSPVLIPAEILKESMSTERTPPNEKITLHAENGEYTIDLMYGPNGIRVTGSKFKNCLMYVDGERLQLDHFHFHAASEHCSHTSSGDIERYPAEVHFVFTSTNCTAVLGVLLARGQKNRLFSKFAWPLKGNVISTQNVILKENIFGAVIGKRRSKRPLIHYKGSLTTPPCAEPVKWFVTEGSISKRQAKTLSILLGCQGGDGNWRVPQDLGDRRLARVAYDLSSAAPTEK